MEKGVFVLGATGPTGMLLVDALLQAGRPVWVLLRDESRRAGFESRGVTALGGDAMDREAVFAAARQAAGACDTIVDLIGGSPMAPPETWPDLHGNINVIDAATAAGFGRFVFVTSVGTGSSSRYVPPNDFTRPLLELKSRAEEHLARSGLRYCIIKPGGLWHREQVAARDRPLVTECDAVRGIIDRTQLVEVILDVLADSRGVTDGKSLYAVTYKIRTLTGAPAEPFHLRRREAP
jgi:nucleoside-diphosphate-sugar epimerase